MWSWTPAAGCVNREFTVPELETELRILKLTRGSGFERLPRPLSIEVTGSTGMGLLVRDGSGNEVGKVLVGYAGAGPRDGGLRNTMVIGGRTDYSTPMYLSRSGWWCTPAGVALTHRRPRVVP